MVQGFLVSGRMEWESGVLPELKAIAGRELSV